MLYISLAVVTLVAIFDVEKKVVIVLISLIVVTYPSVTAIFFYGFTSDAYMLALFFSTCAVFLSKVGEKRFSRFAASALLICLTCAIYQAFLSFWVVLIVIYCIYNLLVNNISAKDIWLYMISQVVIFIVGLALYYAIWKIVLIWTDIVPGEYLGLSTIEINNAFVIRRIRDSINELLYFITESNLSRKNLTFYCASNLIMLALLCFSFIQAVIKSKLYQNPIKLLTIIVLLLVSFLSIIIWNLMSNKTTLSARMLMSTCLYMILTVLLVSHFNSIMIQDFFAFFVAVIVFNYAIIANIGYFTLNRASMSSVYKATELMMQIHSYEEQYDIDRVAFVGQGSNEYPIVNNENVYDTNRRNFYNRSLLSFGGDLLFDNSHAYYYLVNYCGLNLGYVERDEILELSKLEKVKALEVWPSSQAYTVIGNTLVIRLSNNEQYWWN